MHSHTDSLSYASLTAMAWPFILANASVPLLGIVDTASSVIRVPSLSWERLRLVPLFSPLFIGVSGFSEWEQPALSRKLTGRPITLRFELFWVDLALLR